MPSHSADAVLTTRPSHTPLVEESQNLASDMLSPCLLVVHDTRRCSQDNMTELTRRQKVDDPLLQVRELDVIAWRDDTTLVEAAVKLDDDLAVAMVVNFFELANVACALQC
jgi:hypothetical protein